MSEVKTISYAKVVTPSSDNGNEIKQDNMMEKKDMEGMSVTETDTNVNQDAADDNEGFQPVTNKKNEKLKEKEIQRDKDVKKRSKSKKKIRSSKEKIKEKDREKEAAGAVPEKFDSKESSPTPSKSEEAVEFVPAPPPKTNPWKKTGSKPDTPETPDTTASTTATSATTKTEVKQKVETERKKKLSEREGKDQGNHNPKGNPWKKVEAAKESEAPSSPKVIKVEKKSGEPSSWPKLGEEKNKKKNKTNENSSGDFRICSSSKKN